MVRWAVLIAGLLSMWMGSPRAFASGVPFDYKDPKEINAVSLTLDSRFEPIIGYARGISGTVIFDPANPMATSGKIAVDVSSVTFANDGYTTTARGFALQGTKYPQIFFNLRKVLKVTQPSPGLFKATVLADFICRGVTTPMTVPVTANYFPGMAEERTNGKYKGDLLVLRTHFNVSRTRQGISEGIPANMVSDLIEVRVAVAGIHYAPGQNGSEETTRESPVSSGKGTLSASPQKSGKGRR